MRIELHGCPVASDPLGLESKEVTLLTANTWHSRAEAHRAGLRSSDGWSASVYTPPKFTFLQVDFGPSRAIITGIATQCSKNWHCTQKYTLRYSDLRLHWTTYVENGKTRVFDGNNITYPILRHNFRNNITARYLMLVVKQTNQRIGVRMELYGQKAHNTAHGTQHITQQSTRHTALYTTKHTAHNTVHKKAHGTQHITQQSTRHTALYTTKHTAHNTAHNKAHGTALYITKHTAHSIVHNKAHSTSHNKTHGTALCTTKHTVFPDSSNANRFSYARKCNEAPSP
ncbi:Coagulation factor V [Exaiptasia diaphana]|nr:Coagulation factor V [Exaiptasia diaphana]